MQPRRAPRERSHASERAEGEPCLDARRGRAVPRNFEEQPINRYRHGELEKLEGLPPSPPLNANLGTWLASAAAEGAAIEAAPRWEHRMVPGELLVFNNRRMLHGRHAFEMRRGGVRREPESSFPRPPPL